MAAAYAARAKEAVERSSCSTFPSPHDAVAKVALLLIAPCGRSSSS
jgi:hypothetical protein